MSELAKRKPGDGEGAVLKGAVLAKLRKQLGGDWKVIAKHHLEKKVKFKNFRQALTYTNKVGELAESLNHHPDILTAWGEVKLTLWTHSKGGLTEDDFIVAAKIDRLK